MRNFLAVMKIAAINQYVQWLPSLDAVNGTTSVMKKITNTFQIIGFFGGIAMATICAAGLAWASDRWRDRIKTHLLWIFISVVALFAISAIATWAKTYSRSSFG